jgi:predicted  nucleic acid-binding Zn-ribbon protein
MSAPGSALREIHRLRRHVKQLQEEIDRAPRQIKAQEAKVSRHEEVFKEAQETLKKLKVSVHEKEVSLKTTHAQIAKHKKQLNEAAGKKEYDALQAEIAADQKVLQRLEDEILTGMGDTEDRTAQLPQLEGNVKKAKEECAEFQRGAGDRLASLKEQLQHARDQLKEVEASIPSDLRPQFDRITAAKGEDALSLVANRTCSSCYTGITAQNFNDLKNGLFVLCKSCGRILYLPE